MKTTPLRRPTDWQTLFHLPDRRECPEGSANHHSAAPVRPRHRRSTGETARLNHPAVPASADPLLRVDPPAAPRPAPSPPHSSGVAPRRRENSPIVSGHPLRGGAGDGNSAARDAFLTDHARDLIHRLAEWSLKLDRREQDLDARERDLERRARAFRQLQWLAAGASQLENAAAKT
jgi:hypothetical protein